MIKKYSNIIFDLDGTLLDSIEGICYSINEAIIPLLPGNQVNIQDLRVLMGLPIDVIFHLLKPELSEINVKNCVQQFRQVYDRLGWKKAILYPSVLESVEKLTQNKIGVFLATNKPIKVTNKILSYFELSKFVVDTMTPDKIPGKKTTKKDMIEVLIKTHSLIKERTLFVGDTLFDAKAAEKSGIAFAMVLNGYGNKSDCDDGQVIDYEVDTISEIFDIIEGKK